MTMPRKLTDEEEEAVRLFLVRLGDFLTRKSNACPHCGRDVEREKQVGRCVYLYPCGCRAYQGRVRKAAHS